MSRGRCDTLNVILGSMMTPKCFKYGRDFIKCSPTGIAIFSRALLMLSKTTSIFCPASSSFAAINHFLLRKIASLHTTVCGQKRLWFPASSHQSLIEGLQSLPLISSLLPVVSSFQSLESNSKCITWRIYISKKFWYFDKIKQKASTNLKLLKSLYDDT